MKCLNSNALFVFDLNTVHTVSVSTANTMRISRSSRRLSSIPDAGIVSAPRTMPAVVREPVGGTPVDTHSHNVFDEETSESAQRIFMRSLGPRCDAMTLPTVPNQLSSSSDSINDSNSNSSTISNASRHPNSTSTRDDSTIITATNSNQYDPVARGASSGFACPHCNARYDTEHCDTPTLNEDEYNFSTCTCSP